MISLHTVIQYQVFISDTNNLHTDSWFKVIPSNTKDMHVVLRFPVFISNTNNLYIVVWYYVLQYYMVSNISIK